MGIQAVNDRAIADARRRCNVCESLLQKPGLLDVDYRLAKAQLTTWTKRLAELMEARDWVKVK